MLWRIAPPATARTLPTEFLIRSAPRDGTATVRCQTADGTATASEDYVAASGTVIFGPFDELAEVPVQVLGDRLSRGRRDARLRLTLADLRLGPIARPWAMLAPGGSAVVTARLTMPCSGSAGSGETLSAQLVSTATG